MILAGQVILHHMMRHQGALICEATQLYHCELMFAGLCLWRSQTLLESQHSPSTPHTATTQYALLPEHIVLLFLLSVDVFNLQKFLCAWQLKVTPSQSRALPVCTPLTPPSLWVWTILRCHVQGHQQSHGLLLQGVCNQLIVVSCAGISNHQDGC